MQQLFFDTPNGELVVNLPEAVGFTPAERVCEEIFLQRLQDLTLRSGVVYCGVYPDTTIPEDPPARRDAAGNITYTGVGQDIPETVTCHVRSCIAITRLLSCEFPMLFDPHPLETRDRIIALFEYHDGDEPFSGDAPDDGSQDKVDKNRRELQTLLQNIAYLSDESFKAQLVRDFVHPTFYFKLHRA